MSLISFHSYLILNGAIAMGYIISRVLLLFPLFRQRLLQSQRLKFARYSFFIAVGLFFLMPWILKMIPSAYHSNFHLEPLLKNASTAFVQHHVVDKQFTEMGPMQSFFSINMFLTMIFLSGFMLAFSKYIRGLIVLNKIQNNSFCQHKINKVKILFSHSADIPFCWSFLSSHFIVIPNTFLEKRDDLKLAIHHELQHIRQGDTHWLQFLILIKSFCFWNPFIKLWISWFDELQEFSCDEAIVLRKKTSPIAYAECLINAGSDALKNGLLPQGALGIHGLSRSILYRRVNMLFNYNKCKTSQWAIIAAYIISFFAAISAAYAAG